MALKILQVRLVGEHLDVFRNEARTIASLVHPHIIRVFDFGVEAGAPYLVMDYAPTVRCASAMRGTIVSRHEGVPIVKQVSSALHYAHQKHFIHRDIKPENMLLGRNDEVLLSDFGLVLVEQSTSSQITREAAGTLPYMAPEQLQGKPRAASDQYALGTVVYEWLTGDRPFRGGPMELLGQHALTPPLPLRHRVPSVPQSVEAVVLKALTKDPQQRFPDITAFAFALEKAYLEAPTQSLFTAGVPSEAAGWLPHSRINKAGLPRPPPISVQHPLSRNRHPIPPCSRCYNGSHTSFQHAFFSGSMVAGCNGHTGKPGKECQQWSYVSRGVKRPDSGPCGRLRSNRKGSSSICRSNRLSQAPRFKARSDC